MPQDNICDISRAPPATVQSLTTVGIGLLRDGRWGDDPTREEDCLSSGRICGPRDII